MEEKTEAAASSSRTGGVIRWGSRSTAGRGTKLAEAPTLVQCRAERFDLFALSGGSPSTLPRLRRSQTPRFLTGLTPSRRDQARAIVNSPPLQLHRRSSNPARSRRRRDPQLRGTVLDLRQRYPARSPRVLLPNRMNFGGPKRLRRISRGHRLATPQQSLNSATICSARLPGARTVAASTCVFLVISVVAEPKAASRGNDSSLRRY